MEVPMPSLESVDSYFPENPQPCPLPVANPTKSFWLYSDPNCNPLADEGRDAPIPDAVDVAIIGSGISGISTVYHLIQGLRNKSRDVTKIAVFEAREFCSGATGRNGGHCTCYCPAAFASMEKAHGRQDALNHVKLEQDTVAEIHRLVEENGWERGIDLVKGRNIHLTRTEEERDALKANLQAAHEAGVDVSEFIWLSEQQCKDMFGSKGHLSGLSLPGNNLYPLKFVTKLFELCKEQARSIGIDVQLYTHTPVLSVKPSSAPGHYIETDRGTCCARQVVHATNAYASHLLPSLCKSEKPVVPCRAETMAIRPQNDKKFWTAGFSYNEGFEYFFQRPETSSTGLQAIPHIILGGGRSVAPAPHELGVADDSSLNPTVSKYLEDFLPTHFPGHFPHKRNQQIDFHWTGIMGFTKSRNPIVGPVYIDGKQSPGQYILAGFSGHGMSRAGKCAQAVSTLVIAALAGEPAPDLEWLPSSFQTQAL